MLHDPKRDRANSTKGLSLWQKAICRMAERIRTGRITLRFANGRAYTVDRGGDLSAEIYLKNMRPLIRLMTSGDLGFGRAYIDGDWDSPDIEALLGLAMRNEAALRSVMKASAVSVILAHFRHRLRANTRRGSRRNIAYHYDLGNAFYGAWLDETMTYSSALFETDDVSLEDAQKAKYARIIRELGISAADHVLEIGCGWGGFAEYAIATTGCRVTGLTLSREQAAFARQRLDTAAFNDRADIRVEDYRDHKGSYDKVVSIEMFEAVGEENWHLYFDTVKQRLKPGGSAMVQTITIETARFEDYRRNADYIQTYIFPGGMLPTVEAFQETAMRGGLTVKDLFAFGRDYARTLMLWDRDFMANWDRIRDMGFDERFKRMWHYYLHYCAAGFDAGSIDVFQFRLTRA